MAATLAFPVGGVFALDSNNEGNELSNNEDVVYELQDLNSSDGNIITTTQSDIEDGHWNTEKLGDVSPEIYKDFPMQVSSSFDNNAKLNLHFTYFKIVGENDTSCFTMTNRDTNEVVNTTYLTDGNYEFDLKDVALDSVYDISIDETIENQSEIYSAVIATMYTKADMPSNVYINSNGDAGNNSTADSVNVMEMNFSETETIDESGNSTVISNFSDENMVSLSPGDLQSYYDNANDDSLYCVQTESVADGIIGQEQYIGFFSKKPEFTGLGIFVPSYKFYPDGTYTGVQNYVNGAISDLTPNQVRTECGDYTFMKDATFNISRDEKYVIVKHVFKEAGNYTVETLGNIFTRAEVWDGEFNETKNPVYSKTVNGKDSNGGNFQQTYGVLQGQVMYWVIMMDDGEYGNSLFRIKSTNYTNDRCNSIYELEKSDSNKVANNVTYSDRLEYAEDVDIFYIDNSITGEYGFKITNNSSSTMKMYLYNRTNPSSLIWKVTEKDIKGNGSMEYVINLSNPNTHYFVHIQSGNITSTGRYDFLSTTPDKGDPYEPNNSFDTAVDLINLKGNSGRITDLTLHKGDIDYFKFTTGSSKASCDIWLNKVNGIQYNMELYKDVSGVPVLVTTSASSTDNDTIYIRSLDKQTTYYLCVNNKGLPANAYSAVLETTLEWNIN